MQAVGYFGAPALLIAMGSGLVSPAAVLSLAVLVLFVLWVAHIW